METKFDEFFESCVKTKPGRGITKEEARGTARMFFYMGALAFYHALSTGEGEAAQDDLREFARHCVTGMTGTPTAQKMQ